MSMSEHVRELFTLSDARPAYAQAARGAVLWIVFLIVGIAVDQVEMGFQAGFVGWIVSYTDDTRGSNRRLGGAVFVTVAGAVATFIATIAGNTVVWSVIASAGLGAVAVLFGVVGPAGVKKGLVTMFLALFAIGVPAGVVHAGELAIASLVGGIAGAALILASSPFGRARNQSEIAADYADDTAAFVDLYASGASDSEIGARRTAILAKIQDVYPDARYAGAAVTPVAPIALVDGITRILRDTATFGDVRGLAAVEENPATRVMYTEVSRLLAAYAEWIRRPESPAPDTTAATHAVDGLIELVRREEADVAVGAGALRMLKRSIKALDAATTGGGKTTASTAAPTMTRYGPVPLELVWVNLRHDTLLRRHMFRYVTLISAATLLYKLVDIPDGFFIPLGINIMLQPDLASGFTRLQVFSVGTVVGSVIGALIAVYTGELGIAVLTTITIYLVIAYIKVTYWAFAIGISVFIVAALELLIPGGWNNGMWRILNTLMAAGLVAVGLIVLWPSRGKVIVPREFARILGEAATYLAGVLGETDAAALEARRRSISARIGECGLLVEQYAKEPARSEDTLHRFREDLAELRRIQVSIAQVAAELRLEHVSVGELARSIGDSVGETLNAVGEAFVRDRPPRRLPRLVSADAPRPLPPLEAEICSIGVRTQALGAQLPIRHPTTRESAVQGAGAQ